MAKQNGWKLHAYKHSCPRDNWEPGWDAIPGTWNEKDGDWFEFELVCSNCEEETDKPTPYCSYCGEKMMFVEKIEKNSVE